MKNIKGVTKVTIDAVSINLKVFCTKKEITQYGGVKNFKELLYNIPDERNAPEYYDSDLVEEFTKCKS